ncbi:MAG TPA: glycosyltransferase family 2 protein [Pyrinomonadaceae bacterium]|nr:glycosyltransferase family 2 protein [Pyrinomonadaceae bacterium]
MRAKFSVAMCTYNGTRFVAEQLASIAAQTRLPDELVVCDDRSTDATIECIHEFARTAPFPVRVFENEKNIGSTKNFERAVELCEGDFIAVADQDDVWLPEKLQRLEEILSNESTGLVFTDGDVVDENLQPLGQRVWQTIRFGEEEQRLFREGHAFAVLLDHNVVTGAAMALKAEFKKLILPFPDDLTHDGIPVLHDWWTALLIAAVGEVSFVPESLFKYRQHSSQQMGVIREHDEHAPASFRAAARRKNTFAAELHYVRAIRERLSAVRGFQVRASVLPDLEARLTHLETRAAMPERRSRRIAPVLRELLARRYHLYSNGLASAAKDFWL